MSVDCSEIWTSGCGEDDAMRLALDVVMSVDCSEIWSSGCGEDEGAP